LPASAPTWIRIPAIGVSAPVTRVGLTTTRALGVPPVTNANLAGWYKGGPFPGQPGAAVIVGHYDTYVGPAIFYRLRDLRRDARIWIRRADGRTVEFEARSFRRFPKTGLPAGKIYQSGGSPSLRLITCAEPFDYATRHYLDNLVVFASYVRPSTPRRVVRHRARARHRHHHLRRPAPAHSPGPTWVEVRV
jgi:hypothetical protein